MSSPLALAAVTTTLCDLLNDGLINNDLARLGSFSVTALPPDRMETGNNEPNRLNLFLYQVTPNLGWRNEGLPSHDGRKSNGRIANPPLALDLHYMLTAYGATDFAAEILLGYGMEILHVARVLSRDDIRRALSPNNPISVNLIPADPEGRKAIDLADQIEQVKITPHYLSPDELSRMWTAMQARYRPTMVYQVSTVLIQSTRPARAALPVLSRGGEDRGITSQPSVGAPSPSRPTLLSVQIVPSAGGEQRLAAEQGDTLDLTGALLDGGTVTAEFRHPLLTTPNTQPIDAGGTGEHVRVILPQSHNPAQPGFLANADRDWPAGTYTVALRIERTGKVVRRTDEISFRLAPRMSAPPNVSGAPGTSQITIQFFPQVWPEQRLELYVGADPLEAAPIVSKAGTVTVPLQRLSPTDDKVPVTLRIGGVESQLVRDRSSQPPQFDPQQTVSVPA